MADHLILMARYPHTGESQARLVPALGASGAARLQRRLTEHAAQIARRWRDRRTGRQVSVACDGATSGEFRHWLGQDLHYVPPTGGSLGARMAVASVRAFARGADRTLLATVDCPDLDEVQLERAGFALDHADCVLGPTEQGDYYLLGLVAPTPALFAGIPWGTGAVLARTLAAARQERLRVALLASLPSVRGPGDLIHAAPLLERHVSGAAGLTTGTPAAAGTDAPVDRIPGPEAPG
jgi:rSAM/selenodomain-associated transferase 1